MEWYWIALIVVGGVAALYTLFCWIVSTVVLKMATTPVAHTIEEARAYQAENENLDLTEYDSIWDKEEFQLDGVMGKLKGEVVFNPTKSTPAKVAIVCHGHTWNRINSLKYAKIFYDKGYNIVIYDHAYFGESEGAFTTLGKNEQLDLATVIKFAKQKFGEDAFIGLHGESMGAATVLLVLSHVSDLGFVVADCPFSDTMKYYRELCIHLTHLPPFPIVDFANCASTRKFGYNFKKVNPISAVSQSETPICFIHGKADDFIYPSHSEAMYKACKNPLSELHLVDGAGHARSYLTDNIAYCKIVSDFVDKAEQARNK